MKAKVNLRFPKKFITSEEQLMTSSGLFLGSYANKKIWYKTIAQKIYMVSQTLVPVDTGALKKSGKIRINSDGTYRVEYNTPYAMFVHEIIENRHETPTQAKYLEDAAYIVLNEISQESGSIIPLFTFHIEMDMMTGVVLYIDSISMEEFKGNIS